MDDKLQRIQEIQSAEQKSIENFQMLLNAYPEKDKILKNAMAKGAEYLPIQEIENLLDSYYEGLWNISNLKWSVVANEICGTLELSVFHPVAKVWITRTGSASVMIMTKQGQPATIENKIQNCLVSMFPKLKSECTKNAAKSLGVIFGRALNRGKDDDYTYLTEIVEQTTEGAEEAMMLLNTAVTNQYDILKSKIQRATPANMKQLINHLRKLQPNE